MIRYQEKDILRIAKRINNSRRPYLLVNPLQAKHIPVSPFYGIANDDKSRRTGCR